LRIFVLIEESRRDDAAIVLESVGFVADESTWEKAKDGVLRLYGEMPEKDLLELAAVIGVLDWKVAPEPEEEDARSDDWPWRQKPETD